MRAATLKAYRGPGGVVDLNEVVMVTGSSMYGQHTATFVLRNGHKQQFVYSSPDGINQALAAFEEYLICH